MALQQSELTQDTLDEIFLRYPDLEDLWPLTPLQQGMAFESRALADGQHDPYHVSQAIRFSSILPPKQIEQRLSQAWGKLIRRHPSLRICLVPDDLCPGTALVRNYQDYTLLTPVLEGSALERYQNLKTLDLNHPFDLIHGPLIRLYLASLDEGEYVIYISNHHLLIDGWSTPIVLNELLKLFELEGSNNASDIHSTHQQNSLTPAFEWPRHLAWLQQQDREQARCYWTQHLIAVGELDSLSLPQSSQTKTQG